MKKTWIATAHKKNKGITLIALVITIIILLILAGITIAQLTGTGLFGKAKLAKQRTRYEAAKEIINLKLMEIQVDCIEKNKVFDINEIAKGMEYAEDITIEIYYNEETAKIKDGIDTNITVLKGIVVSVDEYSEYKFLIGEECQIIGVLEGKVTDTTSMEDFTNIKEFEEKFGSKVDPTDDMEISTNIKVILEKDILSEEDVKENGYEFATIKGKIEPKEKITKVTINGKDIEFDKETGNISIEVTDNGTYKIIAYGENKTYNYATVKVRDLSEDLNITTKEELVQFERNVNNGRTYKGKTVRLKQDIDLKDIDWKPIGYSTSEEETFSDFRGTFDGENHTIRNMTIDSRNHEDIYSDIGFMGFVSIGSVRNIIFDNPYIYSDKQHTAVVLGNMGDGQQKALIENVKVLNGEIVSNGNSDVGGINGSFDGTIENCYSNCTISGNAYTVGGIAGGCYGKIKGCYNSGNITGSYHIGGIVGYNVSYNNLGIVESCYNVGKVVSGNRDGKSNCNTGGISGKNTSIIRNCYNIGDVEATYPYIGGIVGYNGGGVSGVIVENVYNTGTIKKGTVIASKYIGTSSSYVGTLIGRYGSLSGNYDSITIENMKEWDSDTILQNLGERFKKNTNININDGLPILDWQ